MSFSFLRELSQLNESNVIRSKDHIRRYNAKEISRFAYVHFLVLYIMLEEFNFAVKAVGHASRTIQYGGFKRFNNASTDLYVYLHLLMGEDSEYLKDHAASVMFLRGTHLNLTQIKTRLREMSFGKRAKAAESAFLIALERQLRIDETGLRQCRRAALNWSEIDLEDQRKVLVHLLMFLKQRTPNCDILVHLNAIAKIKKVSI